MTESSTTRSRSGRLPAADRDARRTEILEVAIAHLAEHGYGALTMSRVAAAAGASKETLYAWFGDKPGLLAAMVEHAEGRTTADMDGAFDRAADPEEVLTGFATQLLALLLSPAAVALGQAAISEVSHAPELARLLLAHGRERTGEVVERYLADLHDRGDVHIPDPADGFRLLFGLIVEDRQLRVLYGEPAPDADEIACHAERAVTRFLALVAPAR